MQQTLPFTDFLCFLKYSIPYYRQIMLTALAVAARSGRFWHSHSRDTVSENRPDIEWIQKNIYTRENWELIRNKMCEDFPTHFLSLCDKFTRTRWRNNNTTQCELVYVNVNSNWITLISHAWLSFVFSDDGVRHFLGCVVLGMSNALHKHRLSFALKKEKAVKCRRMHCFGWIFFFFASRKHSQWCLGEASLQVSLDTRILHV